MRIIRRIILGPQASRLPLAYTNFQVGIVLLEVAGGDACGPSMMIS